MTSKINARYNWMSYTMSQAFILKAIDNLKEDEKCYDMHPGSCNQKALLQLIAGTNSVSKLYFIVHLIPLLLKYKKVAQNPGPELRKFIIGFGKSILFVASTLFLIRRCLCLYTKYVKFSNVSAVYTGFLTGFPLLLQSPGRRTEISLFCLNKGIEMLYMIFRRRHPDVYIRYGEGWLLAVSAALLSYYYMSDRELFRSAYKKVLDMLLKNI